MGYEKEVAELWKEWKKSTEKYEEAIEDGYDVDADMWAHDVMEIERQIYVYEQAAKADECEAKAKAFDESLKGFKELERLHEEVRKTSKRNREKSEEYKDMLSHVIIQMELNLGESGE